jgi:hypothetical protein
MHASEDDHWVANGEELLPGFQLFGRLGNRKADGIWRDGLQCAKPLEGSHIGSPVGVLGLDGG